MVVNEIDPANRTDIRCTGNKMEVVSTHEY